MLFGLCETNFGIEKNKVLWKISDLRENLCNNFYCIANLNRNKPIYILILQNIH